MEKPYKCEEIIGSKVCGRTYKSVQALAKHRWQYHNIGKPKKYHCEICDFHNIDKNALDWHLQSKSHLK